MRPPLQGAMEPEVGSGELDASQPVHVIDARQELLAQPKQTPNYANRAQPFALELAYAYPPDLAKQDPRGKPRRARAHGSPGREPLSLSAGGIAPAPGAFLRPRGAKHHYAPAHSIPPLRSRSASKTASIRRMRRPYRRARSANRQARRPARAAERAAAPRAANPTSRGRFQPWRALEIFADRAVPPAADAMGLTDGARGAVPSAHRIPGSAYPPRTLCLRGADAGPNVCLVNNVTRSQGGDRAPPLHPARWRTAARVRPPSHRTPGRTIPPPRHTGIRVRRELPRVELSPQRGHLNPAHAL